MCPHARLLSGSLAAPWTRLSRARRTLQGPTAPGASACRWLVLSVRLLDCYGKTPLALPGSSDASLAMRAVPVDPAGLPVAWPGTAPFPWPATYASVSASGPFSRGASGFPCVTARVSPCLR
jgi:hypothetical protein